MKNKLKKTEDFAGTLDTLRQEIMETISAHLQQEERCRVFNFQDGFRPRNPIVEVSDGWRRLSVHIISVEEKTDAYNNAKTIVCNCDNNGSFNITLMVTESLLELLCDMECQESYDLCIKMNKERQKSKSE